MLAEYRRWLESELKTLGNASHHAYSFGQANMAKRAIERFDAEASGKIIVGVDRESAHHASEAIAVILAAGQMSNDALKVLRDALEASLQEAGD